MITKQQYHTNYFQQKLKEINLQLEELADTPESDRRGHLQLIHEQVKDMEAEFLHVMLYQEETNWPVCEQWRQYQERIKSTQMIMS